jgi:hypothetical protein
MNRLFKLEIWAGIKAMTKSGQKKPSKSSKQNNDRRIDSSIIVAIITLIGTIIAAIVAPIIIERIRATPAPTSTPLPHTSISLPSTPLPFTSTSPPTNTPIIPTLTLAPPTSTFLPHASVTSFTVMNNDKVIEVKPGGKAEVTVGSSLVIRANVSRNIPLEDLYFTWVICSKPGTAIEGQSVTEIPYEATVRSPDCIRVTIKKGDILLTNNSTVNIIVK